MSAGNDPFPSGGQAAAAEAKFRALLEAASDAVVVVDDRGRIVLANSQAETLFGYTRADLLNERMEALVPAWGPEFHVVSAQLRGQRRDGTEFPIGMSLMPFEADKGQVVFATIRGVSEHRRFEETRLRHQTQLVDHAFDAIFTLGPGGLITSWNTGAERLYGHAAPEALGRIVDQLLQTRGLPADVEEVLARTHEWRGELVRVTKDARAIVVDSWMTLTSSLSGPATMEVNRDISGQRRAEAALEAGNRELAEISRQLLTTQETERAAVARELHDEIGQLLTGLRLGLGLARQHPESAAARLADAETLVADLVGRVRSLTLRLRPPTLDEMGLVAALLWLFERYTLQTAIQIDFQQHGVTRRLSDHVETTVYRIVQESLTNIARHASVKRASVALVLEEDTLKVRIADAGRGFDTKTTTLSSSGLRGMRERARLLGGRLDIFSLPGAGTKVEAQLPLTGPGDRTA